jgi:hypothetical protein
MCCNNAYVNKNHEFSSPEEDSAFRIKRQNKNNELEFEGEMHITDRKDNEQLVKHIRTTSSVNKSVFDFNRVKLLA